MPIPPNIQARLMQLKQEAAIRAELDKRRQLANQNAGRMDQPQPLLPWNPIPRKAEGGQPDDDYRSSHTAPSPEFGAPMHDVTRDIYPKDFYGPNGFRYYADFGEHHDRERRRHEHRRVP